jgi:AcrR family transcriptional regulator
MEKRGRPRSFDRDEALHAAMLVFWERGFEATSLTDLTKAMGITSPSLYSAFNSKEELFRAAVELYEQIEGEVPRQALASAPTAREAVAGLLRESVIAFTTEGKPSGCMTVLAAVNCTSEHETIRDFAKRCRRRTESAIRERLERGVAEGDVTVGADTGELAAFYATVLNGLSVQARDGTPRERLMLVVEMAMLAWEGRLAGATG